MHKIIEKTVEDVGVLKSISGITKMSIQYILVFRSYGPNDIIICVKDESKDERFFRFSIPIVDHHQLYVTEYTKDDIFEYAGGSLPLCDTLYPIIPSYLMMSIPEIFSSNEDSSVILYTMFPNNLDFVGNMISFGNLSNRRIFLNKALIKSKEKSFIGYTIISIFHSNFYQEYLLPIGNEDPNAKHPVTKKDYTLIYPKFYYSDMKRSIFYTSYRPIIYKNPEEIEFITHSEYNESGMPVRNFVGKVYKNFHEMYVILPSETSDEFVF